MNNQEWTDLIRAEEEKRRRCADPVQQWKAFQATCAWLDAQRPVPRNSKAGCLRAQRGMRPAIKPNRDQSNQRGSQPNRFGSSAALSDAIGGSGGLSITSSS